MGKNANIKSTLTIIQTIVLGEIATPSVIRARMAFENCRNIEDFINTLYCGQTASWNNVIADGRGNVRGLETIPSTMVVEEVDDWCVRTNTYLEPTYRPYLMSQTYSMPRQEKAEELVGAAFSDKKLSTDEAIAILSYRDAETPQKSITRYYNDVPANETGYGTQTIAFVALEDDGGYFGAGNPRDNVLGVVPSLSLGSFFA